MLGKEVPMPATITEPTSRYSKYHHAVQKLFYYVYFTWDVYWKSVFMFTRSKLAWSLKPVPGHRRPQPHLGTRWNSQKPTWSFEVNLFPWLAQWKLLRTCTVFERFFCVCVSRYDKQSLHYRRCVGEASDSAPCHFDHGCLCKSQRWQAAGGPRRKRGLILRLPLLELQFSVRTSIHRPVSEAS